MTDLVLYNMTDHVLYKMTDLYFEDDHWLLNLKLLLNSAVSVDRFHSPNSIRLHWLGHLPSFTRSQERLSVTRRSQERLSVTTRSVIFKVHVAHLKSVMLKTLNYLRL